MSFSEYEREKEFENEFEKLLLEQKRRVSKEEIKEYLKAEKEPNVHEEAVAEPENQVDEIEEIVVPDINISDSEDVKPHKFMDRLLDEYEDPQTPKTAKSGGMFGVGFGGGGENNNIVNVGGGVGLFRNKHVSKLNLKTLVAGSNVIITDFEDTVSIAAASDSDTWSIVSADYYTSAQTNIAINAATSANSPTAYQDFTSGLSNPAYTEGRVFWDSTNHTLAVYNDISAVTHQLGQEFYVRVINDSGSIITNGSPVEILSATSGFPTITLAQSDITTSHVLGIATYDIPDGSEGLVTLIGTISDMNTSAWSVGSALYLSTNPGELTDTPPTTPYTTVEMCHVIIQDAVNGKILVNINERPLTVPKTQLIYVSLSGTDSSAVDGTEIQPYKTIKFALSQITDNSLTNGYVINVKPGIHNEVNPVELKPYVSVVGLGSYENTIINATVPNQPLFNVTEYSIVEKLYANNTSGFCFSVESSGTSTISDNIINGQGLVKVDNVDAIVLINNCYIRNLFPVNIETGIDIDSGDVTINILKTIDELSATTFFNISGSNSKLEINNFNSDSSDIVNVFKVLDNAELGLRGFDIRNCSTVFSFDTSATSHLFNGYMKNVDAGIIVDGNTTKANIFSVVCEDCAIDLSATSGTEIFGTSNSLRNDRTFIDSATVTLSHMSDVPDDEGFDIKAELHVGSPEQPKETCLGQGDSYVNGMLVYQGNATSALNDISISAATFADSDFSFSANESDQCLYFASDLLRNNAYFAHLGTKLIITTSAGFLSGTDVDFEYWNGSAWTSLNVMISDSDSPYYPFGHCLNVSAGSYQARYDNWELKKIRWKTNDPVGDGKNRYWIRWRIVSPFSSLPIFSQIKLHANRMEINADGWPEYYGRARPIANLPWEIVVLEKAATAPGDQDLYLGDEIDVGGKKNRLRVNETDRVGFKTILPLDCDTSTPILFGWSVIGSSSGGDIDWTLRWGYNSDGDNVYGSAPGTSAVHQK